MCIQAKQLLSLLVPGTFIEAHARRLPAGDWNWCHFLLALGLVFGYAMKNSGFRGWRRVVKRRRTVSRNRTKREGHLRFANSKMPDDNRLFLSSDSGGIRHMAVFHQNVVLPFCFVLQILQIYGRYHH